MEFEYDEKVGATRVTIFKEKDICAKCPEGVRENCPLLVSLICNIVYPSSQSMELTSCTFYENIPEHFKKGVT